MLYVGVDAHKATSQITVVDASGRLLQRAKINSTSEAFRHTLTGYEEPLTAVLEASYCWGPIYDWLAELTAEVVLAHPSKVRAIAEARIKTDKIDSAILAQLLRADLIPRAYAPTKETRALKRVLRQRLLLVQLCTMVKNRIRALLSQHEVKLPQVSDLFGKEGLAWLKTVQVPPPDAALLEEDRELLVFLKGKVTTTEKLIEQLAQKDEAVPWLISLPGVGKFLSVLIRWEVDDITRFPSAKHFASYTGLMPSTYASGARVMHGHFDQARQQVVVLGVHGSGHAGCADIARPGLLLSEDQGGTGCQRCPDRAGSQAGGTHLDGVDRAALLPRAVRRCCAFTKTPAALINLLGHWAPS